MMIEVMMVDYILRRWCANPDQPKNAYCAIAAWQDGSAANDQPLSQGEVMQKMATLRRISPATFFSIFPEEGEVPESTGAACLIVRADRAGRAEGG